MGHIYNYYDKTLDQALWSSLNTNNPTEAYTAEMTPLQILNEADTDDSTGGDLSYMNYQNFRAYSSVDFTSDTNESIFTLPATFSCLDNTSMTNVKFASKGTSGTALYAPGAKVKLSGIQFTEGGFVQLGGSGTAQELNGLTASGNFDTLQLVNNANATAENINIAGNMNMLSVGDGNVVKNVVVSGGLLSAYVGNGALLENLSGNKQIVAEGTSTSRTMVKVAAGGVASKIDLEYVRFDISGTLSDTVISSGNSVTISAGGSAADIDVLYGGVLNIAAGATAANITENGGYVSVADGATATFKENTFSGLTIGPNTTATVHSGTVAKENTISSATLEIYDGGSAVDNTLVDYATILVYSGGKAIGGVVGGDSYLTILNGGRAENVQVSNGMVYVSESGTLAGASFDPDGGYVNWYGNYISCTKGTVTDVNVNAYGSMYLNGGSAIRTTVEGHGVLSAYNSFSLDSTTVNEGGSIRAVNNYDYSDPALLANTTVNGGGNVYLEGHVSASGMTLNSGASMSYQRYEVGWFSANDLTFTSASAYINGGGSVTHIVQSGGTTTAGGGKYDDITLSGGYFYAVYTEIDGAAISDYGSIQLTGGTATNVTLSNPSKERYAEMRLSGGASASNVSVDYDCFLELNPGASADSVTVAGGGWIRTYENTSATNLTLAKGVEATVYVSPTAYVQGTSDGKAFEVKDGVMSDFTVLDGGMSPVICSGGTLVNVTKLESGGNFCVSSGGSVLGKITVEKGGGVYCYGGYVEEIVENGGYVDAHPYYGTEIKFASNTISGLALTSGEEATVHSGTTANSTTIQGIYSSGAGAYLKIYDGGIANDTDVFDCGNLEVSGGTANRTMLRKSGHMRLESGASAVSTTLADGGSLYAANYSGTVNLEETHVSSGGTLTLSPNGYGSAYANGTVIESGGSVYLGPDGSSYPTVILSSTTVKSGGSLLWGPLVNPDWYYNSRGYASAFDTTLESGASVTLGYREYFSGVTVRENALLEISSNGGYATNVTAAGAGATVRMFSYGNVDSATIGSGASIVINHGWANYTTIDDGGSMLLQGMENKSAGAYLLTVNSGTVSAGASSYLENVSAGSGARIEVGSGAVAYYSISLDDGSEMHVAEGGVIAFHLGYTPADTSIGVNGLSRITGAPDYKVMLYNSSQNYGDYLIATGTAEFNGSMTLMNDAYDAFAPGVATLTVGAESVLVGDRYYSLMRPDDDQLSVVVTKKAIVHDDGPDNGWNDYLYDKKNKENPLNPEWEDFEATTLVPTLSNVMVDQKYTVYYKDAAGKLWYNFVGNGEVDGVKRVDTADYATITLDFGACLSLNLEATDATKFTVWQFTVGEDKKGNPTYTQKSLQSTTLKKAKGATTYTATTKNLMLEAGTYYISMESTNIKKGGAAYYNAKLNTDESKKDHTVFYSDGDNGWNNYLYDKKNKENPVNPNRGSFLTTYIDPVTSNVRVDSGTSHTDESGATWNNFVGFGDDTDFARVYLYYGTSLSFTVESTDAATFTIWQFTTGTDKKGNTTYTQKSLQSTALKKAKGEDTYKAVTKNILLDEGIYYISMQSTNARKGGSAYYNVSFVPDNCVFYNCADYGWNDYVYDKKKDEGEQLNYDVVEGEGFDVTVDNKGVAVSLDFNGYEYKGKEYGNFVGYNDETDFRKINVAKAGSASFHVEATDAAKIEIWELVAKTDKKGVTTYSMKSLQSTALKKTSVVNGVQMYGVDTKAYQFKEAGEYYLSVTSTNASKGGNAYYDVSLLDTDIVNSASLESALDMPDAPVSLDGWDDFATSDSGMNIRDELNFGQYAADAPAFGAVSAFDALNSQSEWQDLAKLA